MWSKFTSMFSPQQRVQEPTIFIPGGEVFLPVNVMRTKKWVRWNGKTGIVTDLSTAGVASIHLCTDSGETYSEIVVPVGELRLATYEEIPTGRRQHLTREAAAALGYN